MKNMEGSILRKSLTLFVLTALLFQSSVNVYAVETTDIQEIHDTIESLSTQDVFPEIPRMPEIPEIPPLPAIPNTMEMNYSPGTAEYPIGGSNSEYEEFRHLPPTGFDNEEYLIPKSLGGLYSTNPIIYRYKDYSYTTYTAEDIANVKQMIEHTISVAGVNNMSDEEKVAFWYILIKSEFGYYEDRTSTLTEIINKRTMHCETAAGLSQLYYDMVGIESSFAINKTHKWNKVRINGEWYNVDNTPYNTTTPLGYVSLDNLLYPDTDKHVGEGPLLEKFYNGYSLTTIPRATSQRLLPTTQGSYYLDDPIISRYYKKLPKQDIFPDFVQSMPRQFNSNEYFQNTKKFYTDTSHQKDKVWTITLNQELNDFNFRENAPVEVYQIDVFGNKTQVDVDLNLIEPPKIQVSNPQGYEEGNYFLVINNNLQSKSYASLESTVTMHFEIRN